MKKMTLNRRVLVLMAGTFLVVFSLCFLLFAVTFYYREQEQVKQEIRETFHRLENRVDGYLGETDLASTTVMYSTWVQQLFTKPGPETPQQIYINQSNAQNFLSSFASMYAELDCCIIISKGEYVKNNLSYLIDPYWNLEEQPWINELKENGKYRLFGHNDMFIKKIPDRSVTTYYMIRSIYSMKPIGYFMTNIRYDTFEFLTEQTGRDERILIRDLNGNEVLTTMNKEDLGQISHCDPGTQQNKRSDILYYDRLLDGCWDVWILKERNTLAGSVKKNLHIFLLMIPALIVFAMASYFLSRYLTRPIILCTQALHEVRNENYDVRIENHYRDEIGDMIDGFNDMAKNLGHLQLMNQAMYKARLETEFRILQQRINPHFLCNTLEIINGMILCGEEENALELTGMLGRMYRYDLGENDIADFREEVEYLKNYLSILSYKYPSLQVFYEIDDSVLPCQIPKFVCQPLVENTLKHGFSGRIDDCRLWIRIRRNGEEITIRIKDNGKGIEPELLGDIRLRIEELRKDQTVMISEHIGLLNTARRLFLFFGDGCRFDIRATEGEGTQIDISVKAIEGG